MVKPTKAFAAYKWLYLLLLDGKVPVSFWTPIQMLVRKKLGRDILVEANGLTLQLVWFKVFEQRIRVELNVGDYAYTLWVNPMGYQQVKKRIQDWLKDIALVVQKQYDL